MASEWTIVRAADFIEFNPRLSIKKGAMATKVAMDKLQPFTKKIPATEQAEFAGGSKFCNGDTIMARITPCLENGKTAYVDILADGEVAFGSTEFIVMRAREGISDPEFVYYLATSPAFRNVAIKSMVGSSGRQRVQQGVLDELELTVPPLEKRSPLVLLQLQADAENTFSVPHPVILPVQKKNSVFLWAMEISGRFLPPGPLPAAVLLSSEKNRRILLLLQRLLLYV